MKLWILSLALATTCVFSQMYRIYPKGTYDLKTDGYVMIPIKVGNNTMYNQVEIKKTPVANFSKFHIEWDGGKPFSIKRSPLQRNGFILDGMGKSYIPYFRWSSLAKYDVYNEEELYVGTVSQIKQDRYPALYHIHNEESDHIAIARLNTECTQVDLINPIEGNCLGKMKKHFYRHPSKEASSVKYHWTLSADNALNPSLLLNLATHIADTFWGYGNATDPAAFITSMD